MTQKVNPQEGIDSRMSAEDEKKLLDVHAKLALIPSNENSLIQIEVLFFDMLTILRQYHHSVKAETLLNELRSIHENEYKLVQNKQLTVKNRVAAIRKFKNSFRQSVRKAIRFKA